MPRGGGQWLSTDVLNEFPFDYGKSLVDFGEQRFGMENPPDHIVTESNLEISIQEAPLPETWVHGMMGFPKRSSFSRGPFSASMLVFGGVDERLKYEAYIIHQSKALLNQESKSHHIMFNASHATRSLRTFLVTFVVGGNFAPPTCAAKKLLEFWGLKSWALPMKCLAIRNGEGSMMRKESDGFPMGPMGPMDRVLPLPC